ncbi:MAG: hypothetical protein ACREMJ_12045 [Gemmatimonadales bacterium]
MTEPDRDLQELFDSLRRHAASAAPSFHATLAAARRRALRSRPLRLVATLAAGVVILLLAVTVVGRREPPVGAVDLAATSWQAPTDFLLQTPGADLLRTVPALGTTTLERSLP